ncbi:MAG: hypothetical protein JWM44_2107 [Bacilli bacterium]|nr:hypothetical protein [Bacilli bacterium]
MIKKFQALFKPQKKTTMRIDHEASGVLLRDGELFKKGLRTKRDYLAPHPVDFSPATYRQVGNYYIKTLFTWKWPDKLDHVHLDDLFSMKVDNTISMHQIPVNNDYFVKFLTKRINAAAKEIKSQEKRNKSDGYTEHQKKQDEELRSKLISGKENGFVVSFYIDVHAETLDELEKRVNEVQRTLGQKGMIAYNCDGQNEDAFYAVLPIMIDKLQQYQDMTTSNIADLFPIASSELSMESGVYYGTNLGDNSMIILDRFKMKNPNATIIAPSGGGKSTFTKQEHVSYWAMGAEVYAIDRDNEMRELTKKVKGLYLDYSKQSEFRINPCDLRATQYDKDDFFDLKVSFLITLYRKMAEGLTARERTLVSRSIRKAYENKGFTKDINSLYLQTDQSSGGINLKNRKLRPLSDMIILSDIDVCMSEYPELQELRDKVSFFMEDGPGKIINATSTVDISNYEWVTFGVRNLSNETRPIILYTILDFIENKIKRNMDLPPTQRTKIMVYSDETWSLINNLDGALYMYEYSKRCRKYGGALTTVFQNILDYEKDEGGYGLEILNNTSMVVLFSIGEKAIGADKLMDKLGVNEKVIQDLKRADVGQGYIITDKNRAEFKLEIIPEFREIVTASAFTDD